MPSNLATKLINEHLVDGSTRVGDEIAISVDQVLVNDGSGTLIMLALESLGIERIAVDLACTYVDHLILQTDGRNVADHRLLKSASERFGLWYARPGTGIAHPVHQERFGVPGTTLVGSDSHTPAAGAIGQLAVGAGGMAVTLALVGEPLRLAMPEIWGIELTGHLPDWVSAKDVILELLRRHGVEGAHNCILEYYGDGLGDLSCMDRHVIANMGAELGATTSIFPSDGEVRRFLRRQGREADWRPLAADSGAEYDRQERIHLDDLEPLIAMPSSPGNVTTVREVEGEPIQQGYVGSSANPGYRDFAVVAEIVAGNRIPDGVSLDINPSTRRILLSLVQEGLLAKLIAAGARIHQAGCNGCVGMGQAPGSDAISLRTVPRNFPGRSGTPDDRVALASPETVAASVLSGRIIDPRRLVQRPPSIVVPTPARDPADELQPPLSPNTAAKVEVVHGADVVPLPKTAMLPDELVIPVLLVLGDDVSTDEIMPAGASALPFYSSLPSMSKFAFANVDPDYVRRARTALPRGHALVAGRNYGQGSSREHAALVPSTLGLRVVIAQSIARIHWENLVNCGVLPLITRTAEEPFAQGDVLRLTSLHAQLRAGERIVVESRRSGRIVEMRHSLTASQVEVLLSGGALAHWTASPARHAAM